MLGERDALGTPGERKNLHYSVRCADSDAQKLQLLDQILETEPGSSLIYCSTIKAAKLVHAHLVAQNLEAGLYHGDLHHRVRDTTQDAFMDGRYRIIVATKAFGMGIDKPNTRLVVHYQLPDSIERYVQESGRAGRDGAPARCILLFDPKEEQTQQYFLRQKQPPSRAIAAMLFCLAQHGSGERLEREPVDSQVPERWRAVISADLARLGFALGPTLNGKRVEPLLQRRRIGNWNSCMLLGGVGTKHGFSACLLTRIVPGAVQRSCYDTSGRRQARVALAAPTRRSDA